MKINSFRANHMARRARFLGALEATGGSLYRATKTQGPDTSTMSYDEVIDTAARVFDLNRTTILRCDELLYAPLHRSLQALRTYLIYKNYARAKKQAYQ